MLTLHGECWVITDAAAGNQRQALALAEHLQLPRRHLLLEPRAPWSWLAPRLIAGGRLALPPSQRAWFAPPWPAVAIGCGRAAALFTRLLRPLGEGRCHTVQILDPRIEPTLWDTVVVPRHDELHGDNVLTTLGSLNTVDDEWLADGRDACPHFEGLPRPRVGVLLGGPRRGIALDAGYVDALMERLLARRRAEGGSLLVLGSRRTPATLIEALRPRLAEVPGLLWAGRDDGRNPYPGVLGWADRLVVTPDSVNMLSEACAVGCPVLTFARAPLPPKIARFHQTLRDAGLLHDLDAPGTAAQTPLRETARVAALVRVRIEASQAGLRGRNHEGFPPSRA